MAGKKVGLGRGSRAAQQSQWRSITADPPRVSGVSTERVLRAGSAPSTWRGSPRALASVLRGLSSPSRGRVSATSPGEWPGGGRVRNWAGSAWPPCRLVPWGSVSGAGFTPRAAGVASTPSPPHLPPTGPGVGSPPTEVTALEPSSWGLLPRGPQPETLLSPTWARPVTYVASLTPPGSSFTQIPSRHLPSRVHRAPSLTQRSPQ